MSFIFQCVPYGHRGGSQSIWEHSREQGRLCRVGENAILGFMSGSLHKGVKSPPILQPLNPVVHVVLYVQPH